MNPDTAYSDFLTILKRLDRLQSILGLLGWDELVMMPPASAPLRGEQKAAFIEIFMRESTRPEVVAQLEKLEEQADQLDSAQQAVIRDARRDLNRLLRIPPEFAARKAKAQSASYHAWVDARKNDNFAAFAPHLVLQLQLAQEEAALLQASDPYDYWIDQFDPGMDRATIERLFTDLLPELKALVTTIANCPDQPDTSIFRGFPIDKQDAFLREVVTAMGFDFSRGRIDTAVHPFCGGHGMDTRMTTRFDPDNPLDSLSSVMHETGHALYEQGLPDEFAGSALAKSIGMAVHESQSRLWENQVGRSRHFWQFWEPRYREFFSTQLASVSSEALYRAVNRVAVTPIRVDADEVTYNLHIMLRFELEQGLFNGSIDPMDLPDAWNAASARILGYTPRNHSEGCLQDVHWSEGLFGYFPSYCLGNLLAAQLWQKILRDLPSLRAEFAAGKMDSLLGWLRQNVHSLGRRHHTMAFAKQVTGAELSSAPLVAYLKERYLPLYSNR